MVKRTGEPEQLTQPQETHPREFKPVYDPLKTQETTRQLEKHIDKVNYDFEHWLDVCLAAVEGREEDYMALIQGLERTKVLDYTKAFAALQGFFLDGYYDDVLGTYYLQHHKSNNGYFITPFPVSLMMARMLNLDCNGSVCDPAVGSGSLLLAAKFIIHEKHGWRKSCYFITKLHGQDIGSVQVKMCKLQLYLTNYLHMISRMYAAVEVI